MSPLCRFRMLVSVLVLLGGAVAAADDVVLPGAAAVWLNSPPLSNEMLAGKAAVLYYFEEDCPRCRGRWPEILETAKKFAGKPIVFIGVNSGNVRNDVQQYAREVGLSWPVLIDGDRAFEKASGVGEISLNNIYQVRLLMPDGKLTSGDWSDIEGSANRALATAKWRVEPTDVPEALKPAWLQVEFGNYAAAAAAIKSGVNSPKPDVKSGAEKLQAAVLAELQKQVETAEKEKTAGQKWQAFKGFTELAARFKGYDVPSTVAAELKTLAADKAVRNETTAAKQWEAIQKGAANPNPAAQRTAVAQAQRLVQQFPGTEAAAAAQAALDKVNSAAPAPAPVAVP
jgi:thiol-disulfide isomerase/thioredoxin